MDRPTAVWYHDMVKQAIKEGKDLDADKRFVNRTTQDFFKRCLTESELSDLHQVCKEIVFLEELEAKYLE